MVGHSAITWNVPEGAGSTVPHCQVGRGTGSLSRITILWDTFSRLLRSLPLSFDEVLRVEGKMPHFRSGMPSG